MGALLVVSLFCRSELIHSQTERGWRKLLNGLDVSLWVSGFFLFFFCLVRETGPRMRPRGVKMCGVGQAAALCGAESVCVRFWSYVLLEDEAGQQGGGLFHRQVVEQAVENHLRQQQLVPTRSR